MLTTVVQEGEDKDVDIAGEEEGKGQDHVVATCCCHLYNDLRNKMFMEAMLRARVLVHLVAMRLARWFCRAWLGWAMSSH